MYIFDNNAVYENHMVTGPYISNKDIVHHANKIKVQ